MEDQYVCGSIDGADVSVMSPALRFGQEDQDESGKCSRGDSGDYSVETLRIRVNNFSIDRSNSLKGKNNLATRKFREFARGQRGKQSFNHHVCPYCNRPGKFRQICENRIKYSEFLVRGTDHGKWNNMWYVSLHRKKHLCGNKKLFKKFKKSYGIETYLPGFTKAYYRGKGQVELNCSGVSRIIESIYYTPTMKKNVLSIEQLALQGFEVTFEGTLCHITKSFKDDLVKEREENQDHIPEWIKYNATENWGDLDHLAETKEVLDHFDMLNLERIKEEERVDDQKQKQPTVEQERAILSIKDMVTFQDLLKAMNLGIIQKQAIKEKFKRMVKWFVKYVLKQQSTFPPKIDGQIVDLYNLYMGVQLNGGKTKVNEKNFSPLIAADLDMNSQNHMD